MYTLYISEPAVPVPNYTHKILIMGEKGDIGRKRLPNPTMQVVLPERRRAKFKNGQTLFSLTELCVPFRQ